MCMLIPVLKIRTKNKNENIKSHNYMNKILKILPKTPLFSCKDDAATSQIVLKRHAVPFI